MKSNGGHVGVPNQYCGSWTLFLCPLRQTLSFVPINLQRCWQRSENTLHGLKQRPGSSFFSHLVCQAVVKLFKITILPCRLCSFPGMRLNLHHWAFRVEEVNWGREFYSPVKAVTNFWRNKIYVIITHSNHSSVSVGFNPPDNSS